ncbi:MAG: DUF6491 family protein [Pseudomonadota bacterium]
MRRPTFSTRLRQRLTGAWWLCLLAAPAAFATNLDKGIFLPEGAQAVDSVQWRDIESFTPLSRELILIRTRSRPYLLTLKRACPGLRSDSMIITEQENGAFEPRTDLLRAAPPPNSGLGPRMMNGHGEFNRNGLMEGSTRCRPDALYAVDEAGIEWVESVIAQQREDKKKRRRRNK